MGQTIEIDEFEWSNLHDAVLAEISVVWNDACKIKLTLHPNEAYIKPTRPITITGEGLRRLNCPQENPWGPSDIVNSISLSKDAEYVRIGIEMQSGDVIQVEARSFVISIVSRVSAT